MRSHMTISLAFPIPVGAGAISRYPANSYGLPDMEKGPQNTRCGANLTVSVERATMSTAIGMCAVSLRSTLGPRISLPVSESSSSLMTLNRLMQAKRRDNKWLRQFLEMSSALVLNVAGPREAKAPGIQARAKAFLEELLWEA